MLGLGLGLNKAKKKLRPRNMLVYNPVTWVEWLLPTSGVVIQEAVEVVADGATYQNLRRATSLKSNTKYGIISDVLYNDLSKTYCIMRGTDYGTTPLYVTIGFTGIYKGVFTTGATITSNMFYGFVYNNDIAGRKIRQRKMRLYELSPNSIIESDFTTKTADELNAKYPF
jgi:hypothetical protein